ncbi:MAG: hypothetical protein ABSG54_05770 [Terriglobia bacterium]|jgi:hypothetical protein
MKRHSLDLLHCLGNYGPVFPLLPLVVTVHDVTWFFDRECDPGRVSSGRTAAVDFLLPGFADACLLSGGLHFGTVIIIRHALNLNATERLKGAQVKLGLYALEWELMMIGPCELGEEF